VVVTERSAVASQAASHQRAATGRGSKYCERKVSQVCEVEAQAGEKWKRTWTLVVEEGRREGRKRLGRNQRSDHWHPASNLRSTSHAPHLKMDFTWTSPKPQSALTPLNDTSQHQV
jgi:hypothetical protein